MNISKNKLTTTQQFETLVSEMEKNPEYAKGFRKGIKPLNFDGFWNGVAHKLNAMGPPVRDFDGWHKVWKDMKFKTKKKMCHNNSEARATGGGAFKQLALSPLEEAVANLLKYEMQINPNGVVLGLNMSDDVENDIQTTNAVTVETPPANENCQDDVSPSTSAKVSTAQRGTKRKSSESVRSERSELLLKQTELLERQCSHLDSIKKSLKDVSRYQRKRFEIEEERLKIYKQKASRQVDLMEVELRIKNKKLELLERQLNAQD